MKERVLKRAMKLLQQRSKGRESIKLGNSRVIPHSSYMYCKCQNVKSRNKLKFQAYSSSALKVSFVYYLIINMGN